LLRWTQEICLCNAVVLPPLICATRVTETLSRSIQLGLRSLQLQPRTRFKIKTNFTEVRPRAKRRAREPDPKTPTVTEKK
jgi:hypothetical protein